MPQFSIRSGARRARRQDRRAWQRRRHPEARRSEDAHDRSAGTHGHPRADRFPHARDARRAQLQHRSQLDWRRRRSPTRSSRLHARGAESQARRVARRRDASGDARHVSRSAAGRRRPSSSRPRPINPVYVQLAYGWAMMTPLAIKALNITSDADLPNRTVRKGRERHIDRRDHRQPRRVVRSPAQADLRRAGRRHEAVLPRAQSPRHDGRRRSRAATT